MSAAGKIDSYADALENIAGYLSGTEEKCNKHLKEAKKSIFADSSVSIKVEKSDLRDFIEKLLDIITILQESAQLLKDCREALENAGSASGEAGAKASLQGAAQEKTLNEVKRKTEFIASFLQEFATKNEKENLALQEALQSLSARDAHARVQADPIAPANLPGAAEKTSASGETAPENAVREERDLAARREGSGAGASPSSWSKYAARQAGVAASAPPQEKQLPSALAAAAAAFTSSYSQKQKLGNPSDYKKLVVEYECSQKLSLINFEDWQQLAEPEKMPLAASTGSFTYFAQEAAPSPSDADGKAYYFVAPNWFIGFNKKAAVSAGYLAYFDFNREALPDEGKKDFALLEPALFELSGDKFYLKRKGKIDL